MSQPAGVPRTKRTERTPTPDRATHHDSERDTGNAVSQQNVEVVQRVTRRFACQDIGAALEDIDPEAVLDWSNSDAPDSGVYTGHAAWRAFAQARDEVLGERRFDSAEVIALAADTVLLVGRIREQGRASGVEVEAHGAAIFTLREGKVICLKLYQSSDEALRAVGSRD
jgi:ketosteroid isomerase-like protein